jgi:hypothetical protein
MTRPEKTPLNVLTRFAEILREGKLDASGTAGNLATAVLVEAERGSWSYPLIGGIVVVDAVDLNAMRNNRVDAHVVTPHGLDSLAMSFVEVSWTGTDDEVRTSPVDFKNAEFIPYQVLGSTQDTLL